jgi:nucleoid DNA-binding protein
MINKKDFIERRKHERFKVKIKSKKLPVFKCGKELKDRVNF